MATLLTYRWKTLEGLDDGDRCLDRFQGEILGLGDFLCGVSTLVESADEAEDLGSFDMLGSLVVLDAGGLGRGGEVDFDLAGRFSELTLVAEDMLTVLDSDIGTAFGLDAVEDHLVFGLSPGTAFGGGTDFGTHDGDGLLGAAWDILTFHGEFEFGGVPTLVGSFCFNVLHVVYPYVEIV